MFFTDSLLPKSSDEGKLLYFRAAIFLILSLHGDLCLLDSEKMGLNLSLAFDWALFVGSGCMVRGVATCVASER